MKSTQLGIVTPESSVTPDYIGQHYVNTAADLVYVAYGLTSADWQEIGAGGGGILPLVDLGNLSANSTVTIDLSAPESYYSVSLGDDGSVIDILTNNVEYKLLTIKMYDDGYTFQFRIDGVNIAPTGAGQGYEQLMRFLYVDGFYTFEWLDSQSLQ